MLQVILTLLLLALAAPCHADPLLLSLVSRVCNKTTTINCVSEVQSGATEDTGTENRCMNSGDTVTWYAVCSADIGQYAYVQLLVDGTPSGGVNCNGDGTIGPRSWVAPSTACYNLRILGARESASGSFSGTNFVVPGT